MHSLDNSLFNSRDILTRDHSADDLVLELESGAARQGFDLQPCISVLSVTTGLFLVFTLGACLGPDRFLVGDFRGFHRHVGPKFSPELLKRYLKMHLAHA